MGPGNLNFETQTTPGGDSPDAARMGLAALFEARGRDVSLLGAHEAEPRGAPPPGSSSSGFVLGLASGRRTRRPDAAGGGTVYCACSLPAGRPLLKVTGRSLLSYSLPGALRADSSHSSPPRLP